MRAHVISNNIVVNTIEVESLDFMPGLVEATAGSIGWSYDGQAFTPPEPPTQTPEELQQAIIDATQKRLTDFAAERGYSSLEATSKYKDISDAEIDSLPAADRPLVTKFRTECRYVALVTAQTWATLYRGLADVQAGKRPMPASYAEIAPELPALVWPV